MNREDISRRLYYEKSQRKIDVDIPYIESTLKDKGYVLFDSAEIFLINYAFINFQIENYFFDFDPIKSSLGISKFLLHEYENCIKHSLYIVGEYINDNMKLFISGDNCIYAAQQYTIYEYSDDISNSINNILINEPYRSYTLE